MRNDHDWFQTASGKRFWAFDPHVDDLDIMDIAHALSMKCRYGGHTREYFSVAQHSVIVAQIVNSWFPAERRLILTALMHDAAEAYSADVVRPIKRRIPQFKEIEERIEAVIAQKFDLIFPFPRSIKEADNMALNTERRDLLTQTDHVWNTHDAGILPGRIVPLDWRESKKLFLYLYNQLQPMGDRDV